VDPPGDRAGQAGGGKVEGGTQWSLATLFVLAQIVPFECDSGRVVAYVRRRMRRTALRCKNATLFAYSAGLAWRCVMRYLMPYYRPEVGKEGAHGYDVGRTTGRGTIAPGG
jgi:hypothetical protein